MYLCKYLVIKGGRNGELLAYSSSANMGTPDPVEGELGDCGAQLLSTSCKVGNVPYEI